LTREKKFDEALAALRKAKPEKLRGVWRHSILLSIGETQAAAGRKDEALATYKGVAAEADLAPHIRKMTEARIEALEGKKE